MKKVLRDAIQKGLNLSQQPGDEPLPFPETLMDSLWGRNAKYLSRIVNDFVAEVRAGKVASIEDLADWFDRNRYRERLMGRYLGKQGIAGGFAWAANRTMGVQFVWTRTILESCDSCVERGNYVFNYETLVSIGFPGSDWLDCGANCHCILMPTDMGETWTFGRPARAVVDARAWTEEEAAKHPRGKHGLFAPTSRPTPESTGVPEERFAIIEAGARACLRNARKFEALGGTVEDIKGQPDPFEGHPDPRLVKAADDLAEQVRAGLFYDAAVSFTSAAVTGSTIWDRILVAWMGQHVVGGYGYQDWGAEGGVGHGFLGSIIGTTGTKKGAASAMVEEFIYRVASMGREVAITVAETPPARAFWAKVGLPSDHPTLNREEVHAYSGLLTWMRAHDERFIAPTQAAADERDLDDDPNAAWFDEWVKTQRYVVVDGRMRLEAMRAWSAEEEAKHPRDDKGQKFVSKGVEEDLKHPPVLTVDEKALFGKLYEWEGVPPFLASLAGRGPGTPVGDLLAAADPADLDRLFPNTAPENAAVFFLDSMYQTWTGNGGGPGSLMQLQRAAFDAFGVDKASAAYLIQRFGQHTWDMVTTLEPSASKQRLQMVALRQMQERTAKALGPGEITLYRGFVGKKPTSVAMNPISSWTPDKNIARMFADGSYGPFATKPGEKGWIVAVRVPRDRVLAVPATGMSDQTVHEALVIAGDYPTAHEQVKQGPQ